MDPYDEIAEQLESAQDQGFQALKRRLESILAALDQASSSVQDVLSDSPDQLFPLGEVPGSIAGLRAAVGAAEGRAADAEAALTEAQVKADESAAEEFAAAEIVTLDVLRRFEAARSQSDLLHDLLSVLAEHVSRAVVLVIRSGGINAWSGIGFADGSRLEQWTGDVDLSPALTGFVEDPRPMWISPVEDPVLAEWVAGDSELEEAVLVPVTLRGKTMGAVYADRLAGGPWNPEAVQTLVAISCWLIDNLHHRIEGAAPMLTPLEPAEVEAEPRPEVVEPDEEPALEADTDSDESAEAELEAAEPTEAEFEPGEPAGAEFEPGEPAGAEIEPDEPDEVEEEPAAAEPELEEMASEPEFDPSATVQVDVSETLAKLESEGRAESEEPKFGIVEEQIATPTPADEGEYHEGQYEFPEAEVSLPPPVEPVVPPSVAEIAESAVIDEGPAIEVSPEDETHHEEARRFARLLVSEIKLYNEGEVERGRENSDLYLRLKEDIDRSREMYEKRIPPEIRAAHDYFQDELIRILASGEAEALGM